MTTTDVIKIIEQQLAHGEMENAVQLLLTLSDNKPDEYRQQTLLLASQYRDFKKKEALNLEVNVKDVNRINLALIDLANQLKTHFGTQIVDEPTASMVQSLTTKQDMQHAARKPIEQPRRLKYGLGLGVLAIVVAGYFIFNFLNKDNKNAANTTPSVETASKAVEPPATTSGSSAKATFQEKIQPVLIDKKAKFRNLELLETRYFPTDGVGSIEFDFNFDCPYGASGGCGVGANNVILVVNNTEILPADVLFNRGKSSLFYCNTDGLLTLRYNDIPPNTTKVALKVSESLFSTLTPMVNPMTIDVDLTKTQQSVEKPIVLNVDTEKDFNIQKNYGYIQVRSVKAAPHSDNDVAVKLAFSKNLSEDFYECCIRLLADKRRIGGNIVYAQKSTSISEGEITFIVPRTTRETSIMVGKCTTASPYTIPLSWE